MQISYLPVPGQKNQSHNKTENRLGSVLDSQNSKFNVQGISSGQKSIQDDILNLKMQRYDSEYYEKLFDSVEHIKSTKSNTRGNFNEFLGQFHPQSFDNSRNISPNAFQSLNNT